MKVLSTSLAVLLAIITSIVTLVSCGDEETDMPKKVYYAYYEFSDDALELYDIHINIIAYNEFENLEKIDINSATPYKINEKTGSKSYLIRFDGTGKGSIYFQTIVKSAISDYKDLEKLDRKYEIMYGYSFHKLLDGESDSDATTTMYYGCIRQTEKVTAKELAEAPANAEALTKYESIQKSIETSTSRKF